jgi:hypothetical protein
MVSFCVGELMANPCFPLVQYPRLNGGWSGPREASLRGETQPGRRKLSSSEKFNLFAAQYGILSLSHKGVELTEIMLAK